MELEHSFTIPVPAERAWQVLLDVEQVAPCMPGATVDSVNGDVITGRIKVKVGPVALTYSGSARFTERDEQARSVTLEASGKETRGSGTAAATVRSSLRDEGGQTRVVIHTTMSVTGRPAQFGRGVMAEVGGRIIERFSANLAAQLAGGGQPDQGGAAVNGAGPAGPQAPARAAVPDATLALPVEELQLPLRAFNSLRREGIHTVGDLSARSEAQLLAIANLGPQSIKEIKQKLAERGLALASSTTEAGAGGPAAGPAAAAAAAAAAQDGTAAGQDSTRVATGRPDEATGRAREASGPAAGAAAREGRAAGGPLWGATPTPPRGARPPDEDAIDLLSVAGFPVLKRALPVVGVIVAALVILLRARRRRRHRAAGPNGS
jgi:carbon monoxide dehydrogenase subunit G